MSKVMLAMSGGVDSSVAVALLLEAGYEVEGITMCLGDFSVVEKAALTAEHFKIKHHWLDLAADFDRDVKSYFVEEYRNGRTPNPCVVCNQKVKMGKLFEYAETIGFDFFATGHYANIVERNNRYAVARAAYLPKDQSYVLYPLGQNVLSRLILPLGDLTKDQVRQKASEMGLEAAKQKESQDICFIPDGDYRKFLAERGLENQEGNFVLKNGKIVGRHKGLANYTIGQRKGLGIALGYPVFVTAIRSETNEVVLGLENDLLQNTMLVEDCNYQLVENLTEPRELDIKIRYRSPVVKGLVKPLEGGRAEVEFLSPEKAVTPGQSAVFYDGDVVFGGGVIVG
jgi:tRNA-specific 2-thiouridylase